MSAGPGKCAGPVTLLGGGAVGPGDLGQALALAPRLIAADGGANALGPGDPLPELILGDLDSLADPEGWAARGVPVRRIVDQDTTDFEKALAVAAAGAPFAVGVGFLGRRLDHALAVLSAMVAEGAPPVVLLGEDDAVAAVPPARVLALELEARERVSIFPLCPVRGTRSVGLEWSVEGLEMAPGGRIGTSNRALGGTVEIAFDRPGALLLLERRRLASLLKAVSG